VPPKNTTNFFNILENSVIALSILKLSNSLKILKLYIKQLILSNAYKKFGSQIKI
jgi:hypothetical protein